VSRKIKAKKKRRPTGAPVMPREKTPLERLERRLRSLEVIVGMDDEKWPILGGVETTTPLGLVLHELGMTDEEIPEFVTWLRTQIKNWRNVQG
jgi:hypothetical protein